MTALGASALHDAAVVGGRAVPVGRDEARAEEGDPHDGAPAVSGSPVAVSTPSSRAIASSSSTRWRAGVTGEDRLAAVPRERVAARSESCEDVAACAARICRAVAGDEVVAAGREQTLDVVPGRRDERDAAGERLEHTDRRDAGQRLGRRAGAARARSARGGEDVAARGGSAQPAAVVDARARAIAQLGLVGIAHAVHRAAQARASRTGSSRNSRSSALRSSSPQLPIQTRSPSRGAARQRPEEAGVGRLVPRPRPRSPSRDARGRARGSPRRRRARRRSSQVVARPSPPGVVAER